MKGQSPASSGPSTDRLRIALQNLTDRVRRLESKQATPRPARVGPWTLTTDDDGNLIALHDNGERRRVASLNEGE